MILILRKDKYILGRIGFWNVFLGIWGEAKLFLGIWGTKVNTFRETRTLFAGRRGDQCIIFRDQGSTGPPWGPHLSGICSMYSCTIGLDMCCHTCPSTRSDSGL